MNISVHGVGCCRKYQFPPETVQQVLNSEHRTNGIEMLVTGQRAVLLDTEPLLSPSVVDLLAQGDRQLPADAGSVAAHSPASQGRHSGYWESQPGVLTRVPSQQCPGNAFEPGCQVEIYYRK